MTPGCHLLDDLEGLSDTQAGKPAAGFREVTDAAADDDADGAEQEKGDKESQASLHPRGCNVKLLKLVKSNFTVQ